MDKCFVKVIQTKTGITLQINRLSIRNCWGQPPQKMLNSSSLSATRLRKLTNQITMSRRLRHQPIRRCFEKIFYNTMNNYSAKISNRASNHRISLTYNRYYETLFCMFWGLVVGLINKCRSIRAGVIPDQQRVQPEMTSEIRAAEFCTSTVAVGHEYQGLRSLVLCYRYCNRLWSLAFNQVYVLSE